MVVFHYLSAPEGGRREGGGGRGKNVGRREGKEEGGGRGKNVGRREGKEEGGGKKVGRREGSGWSGKMVSGMEREIGE